MEHWLPLFYDRLETLFDYLPDDALIGVDHLAREARDERLAMIADAFEAREQAGRASHYRALPPGALYLPAEEWDEAMEARPSRRFTPFQQDAAAGAIDMGAKPGRTFAQERAQDSVNLFEATADHARRLAAAGKRVLFASWSEGSSERLGVMLADHGLKGIALAPYWQAAKAADPKKPQRAVLPLEAGFETDDLAVISETDILGDRLARPAPPPARRQLPGRGLGPDARRPGGPHRPRHRPLRGPEDPRGDGRAARLPGAALRRRGQALPAGGEHRPAHPLRGRERGRRPRPPGRRGLAGAQGPGQGAAARDGRRA